MRLVEALEVLKSAPSNASSSYKFFLACGFQPLHLETLLKAHLQQRFPDRLVESQVGLFGSLAESLKLALQAEANVIFVVIEWADLDPRLSLRSTGSWTVDGLRDINTNARESAARIAELLIRLAERTRVVVGPPTTRLVPASSFPRGQVSPFEGELRAALWAALAAAAAHSVAVIDFPLADGGDPKAELGSGFPYTIAHAALLAEVLVSAACRPEPKKALITDLDNTLWLGIVGEVGPEDVRWDLDHRAAVHGAYQRCLASLADSGILLAVASKNDEKVARQALGRPDILVSADAFFPIDVSWGSKADAVSRILAAWNVGADAVVFVDDTPLELAVVSAAHSDVTCVEFPGSDKPAEVVEMLRRLRGLFGTTRVTDEDRIRLESIRAGASLRAAFSGAGADEEQVLRQAEGVITIACGEEADLKRAYQLINKTNQFNLNGVRIDEAEWTRLRADKDAFILVVSYRDKYGDLGKIAVVCGHAGTGEVDISHWVMSCRAFSRRIEYHTIDWLLSRFDVTVAKLDFKKTERNGPLQDVLRRFGDLSSNGEFEITRKRFLADRPSLIHSVIG